MIKTGARQQRALSLSLEWLRARIPIAWVQLGVLFTFLLIQPIGRDIDPDFWWHLRTGDLIVHSGIPRHDVFSWTAAGQPWVAHEWLGEAIIYGVESTFGYVGNALLFGLATIAALALMYALGRRRNVGTKPLVLLMLFSTMMLALFVTVRPQVFTWLLFAVFVYIIQRHEDGDDAVSLWALPALMAVWVNLHLGFVYGLMVVGVWVASRLVQRLRGRDVELRMPLLIAAACGIAALANPAGPEIFVYPVRYFQDRQSLQIISEWQRPSPLNPILAPFFVSAGLMLLSLVSKHRPGPFLFLLTLAVIAIAGQAVRNVPFVAFVLPPVVGPALAGHWQWARAARDSRTRLVVWQAAAVLLIVAMGSLGRSAVTGDGLSVTAPNESTYPAAGAAYVTEHLPGARLYNEYNWGGYLVYKLPAENPIFIDGRTDFYRAKLLNDYATIGQLQPGWEDLMRQYGIDAVLLRKNSRLAVRLREDSGWQEVFTGDVETVLVRVQEAGGHR
jgi:hypothetical protein